MDLTLTDEQSMLRESAQRFVRDGTGKSATDLATTWLSFAELGWLALPLPEGHGGLDGSMVDVTVLLEELGRAPSSSPYVGTVVLGAGLITACGSDAQMADYLPRVAAGDLRLALAHIEPGPRGGIASLTTKAVAVDGGYLLTGSKITVLDADQANTLIVSAQMDGRTVLMLVPRNSTGVSIVSYPGLGGGNAATVSFNDVTLAPTALLGVGDASNALDAAIDAAITALCAEAVGMMAELLDVTVSYTNTREQFGKPLNANQSVRFKLADMEVALEEARSMVLRAALTLSAPVGERVRATAGAKAGIGRRGRLVAELAIQLHGAMGVTDELTVGTYYKRLLAFEAMFGGVDHQLARHARASGRLASERVAA